MKYNRNIATYFRSKTLYLDEPTQKKPNTRKLVEQPWQQIKGGKWDEVTETLCNLDFIQAKAAARMTYELINDFVLLLFVIPDNQINIQKEKERQAILDKYAKDLILNAKGEKSILEIPASVKPWLYKHSIIEIERLKSNPTRLDVINSYFVFLGNEAGILHSHAQELPNLSIQQAWNNYDSGPVGNAAFKVSKSVLSRLFLRSATTRAVWCPIPQVVRIFKQHLEKVNAVALSSDGKYMLSGSEDKTCILWDQQTGEPVKTLHGHKDGIKAVAITPDGRIGLSGSYETIIMWNLESGQPLNELKKHKKDIHSLAITADAKFAISGSSDKTCIFWDLKKGQPVKTLIGHNNWVRSVAITPNGKQAISGDYDCISIIWDLEKGSPLITLEGHSGSVNAITISVDGKLALTGSDDETCILWDLRIGNPLKVLKGYSGRITALAMTPDAKYAVTGSGEHLCLLWDLEFGRPLKVMKGHTSDITDIEITPDGKYAISSSEDMTLIMWDLERSLSEPIFAHPSSISRISVSLSQKFAISLSWDNKIFVLWDLDNRQPLKAFTGHDNDILDVVITPDGKLAVTGSSDKTCILWNLESGLPLKTLKGHSDQVNTVAVSLDGIHALSGSKDKTCILWDLNTGKLIHRLTGHNHGVMAVAITPDGNYAVSGAVDGICIVWDLRIGEIKETLIKHTLDITSIAISNDGNYALTGSLDETCILWDLENGRPLKQLKGHKEGVRDVVITTDGKYAISNSYDETCILWDLETASSLKTLTEPIDGFSTVALAPDGKLALIGTNKTFVHWNIQSEQPNYKYAQRTVGSVEALVVPKDGKIAVTKNYVQNHVWDIESGILLNKLKGGQLTSDAFTITQDGKVAISGDVDGNCILWDTGNGLPKLNFVNFKDSEYNRGFGNYKENPVTTVVITPDGNRAISGDECGNFTVWNIRSGLRLKKLNFNKNRISKIILSPSGTKAFIGSWESCILYDLVKWKIIKVLSGHKANFSVFELSPDWKLLLSGSHDGNIIIWDTVTGKSVRRITVKDFQDPLFSMTPLGNLAVIGDLYKQAFAYCDLKNGVVLRTLNGHTDNVTALLISNNGNYAISTSRDHKCALWDLNTGEKLNQFIAPESIGCFSLTTKYLVLGGCGVGELYFITLPEIYNYSGINHALIRPIWDFNKKAFQKPTCDCPFCGRSFEPEKVVLDSIEKNKINKKPEEDNLFDFSKLPWEDTYLSVDCPFCGEELRLSIVESELLNSIKLKQNCSEFSSEETNPNQIRKSKIKNKEISSDFPGKSENSSKEVTRINVPHKSQLKSIDNIDFAKIRAQAADYFELGEYKKANDLLVQLLENDFEPLSIRIHLARIAVMSDDFEEAYKQIMEAWERREEAVPYVLARILWFQLCLSKLGVGDKEPMNVATQLGDILRNNESRMEWWMQPVLDHIENRLQRADYSFLSFLLNRMNSQSYRNDNGEADHVIESINAVTEETEIFTRIKTLLNENKIIEALEKTFSIQTKNDSLINTIGVCMLRQGNFEIACEHFNKIACDGNWGWKENVNLIYKRNYLTVLLLLNREEAYLTKIKELTITEILDEGVQNIIRCYKSWKETQKLRKSKQPILSRLFSKTDQTKIPIGFDFPLGELDY